MSSTTDRIAAGVFRALFGQENCSFRHASPVRWRPPRCFFAPFECCGGGSSYNESRDSAGAEPRLSCIGRFGF
jgi:hypothetical protein